MAFAFSPIVSSSSYSFSSCVQFSLSLYCVFISLFFLRFCFSPFLLLLLFFVGVCIVDVVVVYVVVG